MTTGLATEEDEWSQFTLGDLCSLITDGKHGDSEDQSHSGFYFLSVKDILGNRLVYENARQITEVDFSETNRRTNLQPGDVLFTNTGTIGRIAIAGDDPRTYRTTFQKSVAILKPRRDLIDPRFLYYLLHFDNANLSEFAAGTTQKNLLLKDIRSFEVKVPPLREQHAIAHILGTLDDKIELNRRMNQTLEAMARAIFQDWFVDFGPVRAKLEGQDPYLPPELWGLFPDDLVDSELGDIPEGWEVGVLHDIVELLSGGTPRTSVPDYWDGNIPWYTPKDAPDPSDIFALSTERSITQAGVDNSSTKVLPTGTTIISARGTVGRLACLGVPMAMNQTCYGIRGACGYPDHFTYWNIKNSVNGLLTKTHGTIFDTITRETFQVAETILVPTQVALSFESTVNDLMGQIRWNLKESRCLAAQRDVLLPKLVSGELKIRDIALCAR